MLKRTIGVVCALAALLALGCQSAPQQEAAGSSRCLRVYSAADYQIHQEISHWWPRHNEVRDIVDRNVLMAGTGFAVETGGKRFVVTAAHVAMRTWNEGEAVRGKYSGTTVLNAGSYRIRVSSLAYSPQRMFVDPGADIAVLEMPSEFWQKFDLVIFALSPDLPPVDETVKAWGFPGTPVPQVKGLLSVVAATSEMVVANDRLDPGFSGGPLVTAKSDRLVGMILRSTEGQIRALPVGRIQQALGDFDQKALPYNEPTLVAR